ncbi:MAG: GNAT family N-acetyltransferase [Carbonactinosporaceae bacterium]
MYRERLDDDVELAFPLVSDAQPLFELVDRERERLRVWLSWPDNVRSADDQRAFLSGARKDAAAGRCYPHLIRVEGSPAGLLALEVDEFGAVGEVGYWLGSRYEGRGIVTRGVSAVLERAFGRLGLHRVEIKVAPDNVRSRAVPQRLGFTREGVLREAQRTSDGDYRDLELWSVLATEWPQPLP